MEPPCINIFLSTSPGIINRYVKVRGFLRFVSDVLETKHLLYMQCPACLTIAEKGETNNQAVNFGPAFVIKLKVALSIL